MNPEWQRRVDAAREALQLHRPYSKAQAAAWVEDGAREQQARRLRYRAASVLCAVSLIALGCLYFNHMLPPSLNFAAGLAAPTLLAGAWLAWWYTWQEEFNEATNERARRDLPELPDHEVAALTAMAQRHAVVAEIVRRWAERKGLVLRDREVYVLACCLDAMDARDHFDREMALLAAGTAITPG